MLHLPLCPASLPLLTSRRLISLPVRSILLLGWTDRTVGRHCPALLSAYRFCMRILPFISSYFFDLGLLYLLSPVPLSGLFGALSHSGLPRPSGRIVSAIFASFM